MIGKIMPYTATFGPRSMYMQFNKQTGERRDTFTILRNLEGTHPDYAHVVMQATARQNRRVKNPSGHLILSWAHGDAVDDETMIDMVDQTMADLGLSQHQAMYVAHDDTEHRHVHVLYNRIHPETHTAARDGFQRLALRKSLMRQEQIYGLTPTPFFSKGREQRRSLSEIQLAERQQRDELMRMSKQRCERLREVICRRQSGPLFERVSASEMELNDGQEIDA